MNPKVAHPQGPISRRVFLRSAMIAVAASVASACGATPTPVPPTATKAPPPTNTTAPAPAATKPPAAPTVAAAPKAIEPGKVTFLIWGGEAEQKAWEARRQGFKTKYPMLDVEITIPPGTYAEKLTAMIAGGTAPDTFASTNVRCDAQRGLLLPLDDLINADPDFDKKDWYAGVLDGGKVKGVQYAIPGGLGPQVLIYNTEYFKEAGLENPNDLYAKNQWNYAKFLEYAKKLNKKDSSGKVTVFAYMPYTPWWTYIHGMGGNPFNADYTVSYMDQEKNYKPVQWYADLWFKEKVAPGADESKEFGSWPGFRDGKYAMFLSGPWQQARLADSKFKWDIAWPPVDPGGAPVMNAGGGGSVIYAKAKRTDAAFKWINYVESKEGQAVWAGLGFDIPSHPSIVADYNSGKFFTNPKAIPPSIDIWYKVVEKSIKSPHTYISAQATDLLNQAWSQINAGTATADQVFPKINADVTKALASC